MRAIEGHPVRVPITVLPVLDELKQELEKERGGRWGRGDAIRALAEHWRKTQHPGAVRGWRQ